jgi:hypothetical protein
MTMGLESQIDWEYGRRKSAALKINAATSNHGRISKSNCIVQ